MAPVERESLVNAALVQRLLDRLAPLGHHDCPVPEAREERDLGLGLLYYTLIRVLKPRRVLMVGSLRGFSVVCMALGLEDNGAGDIDFVDAARVDDFWTRTDQVRQHFGAFNVDRRIHVHVMTSAEYVSARHDDPPDVNLLFIDGDHTEPAARFDHENLGRLVVPGGYVVFHDSYAAGVGFTEWQVAEYLGSLHEDLHEILNVEVALGLTILRKLAVDAPDRRAARRRRTELRHLCRTALASSGHDAAALGRLATLALEVLKDERTRERTYESRLRLLRKANTDLWSELRTLRPARAAGPR